MKVKLKPISEQVVVITGASSGIGLTTARLAAARVWCWSLVTKTLCGGL